MVSGDFFAIILLREKFKNHYSLPNRGFSHDVMSNFTSHHTHDHHVGFLQSGVGKPNKMLYKFSFSSCQTTKRQSSDKNTGISTHSGGI